MSKLYQHYWLVISYDRRWKYCLHLPLANPSAAVSEDSRRSQNKSN